MLSPKSLYTAALLSAAAALSSVNAQTAPASVSHAAVRENIVRHLQSAEADVYSFTVFGSVLEEKLQALTKQMSASAAGPEDTTFRLDYAALARELGLTQVVGIGYSSVPRADGFENRMFFATQGARSGLLSLCGGAPHAFDTVVYAPADTDIFLETDVHLEGAIRSVLSVLARVKPEAAAEFAVDRLTDSDSSGVFRMLLSLKGRATFVLRMGEFLPKMPEETATPAAAAKPLAVFLRVEGIGAAARKMLEGKEGWAHRKDGGRDHYTLEKAGAEPFKPVLMIEGTTLHAALSEEFLNECLARTPTGLAAQAPFQSALRELGDKGNSLTYVSPAFFKSLRNSLVELQGNPLLRLAARNQTHLLDYVLQQLPQPENPVVSVATNLPEGVLTRSWSPRSLSTQQFALGLLNPELLGDLTAALVISAHADTAKKRELAAKSAAIQENLKRLDAAAQRHFAANTEAQEVTHAELLALDPSLAEMKPAGGEDYSQLVIRRKTDLIEIYTPDADRVTLVRPLTDAQTTRIKANLALFDEAAALYFAKNPAEETMSPYSATEFVAQIPDQLESAAGEDYAALYINKSDTELQISTPGGQTVTYTRDPQVRFKAIKKAARKAAELQSALETAHTAAEAYFAKPVGEGETPPESVSLAQLKESAGVALPEGATDEEAHSITFNKGSYEVTGVVAGKTIKVLVPLPAKQREAVAANLAKIAKLGAAHLQKHPDELVVFAGELVGSDKTLPKLPDPVVGEEYATVEIRRGEPTVSITLPTSHVIAVPLK